MNVFPTTCLFIIRDLCRGLAGAAVGLAQGELTQHVFVSFQTFFTDQSESLLKALQVANRRAWQALELSLRQDSWWNVFQSAEEKALAAQMRGFLSQVHHDGLPIDKARCLAQIQAARKKNLLDAGNPTPQVKGTAGQFARYADPASLLEREKETLDALVAALRKDYPDLAQLLKLEAARGESLLASAARYFFRRAIEEDARLARSLAEVRLEKLQATQEVGFQHLERALQTLGDRVESLLDGISEKVDRVDQKIDQLAEAIASLQKKLDLDRPQIRPQDSLAVSDEAERRAIRQLIARYRALPEVERCKVPQLLSEVGKLEVVSGDFQAAEKDFQKAAELATTPALQAEAHFNAYQAALEQRDWNAAYRQLMAALGLDADRFAPFHVDRFRPLKILGAGGFGVVFLCEHCQLKSQVVVKTLQTEGLGRDADAVLDEARILFHLDHPSIVPLMECDYTRPATRERPFFVMRYFEGQTLEEVARDKPLPDFEFIDIAQAILEGLSCAHQVGVLHRDVKPANILVRKAGENWLVKIIDFGLAVPSQALQSTARLSKTLFGETVAGTVGYAAPEQMGRWPGVEVGSYTDVYGFGKTCCYALFGTPNPLPSHWSAVTPSMAKVIEACIVEDPRQRLQTFSEVAARLRSARVRRRGNSAESETTSCAEPDAPDTNGSAPLSTTGVSGALVAEVEHLIARLRQRFDLADLEKCGGLLRQLRQLNDPKLAGVLAQVRPLLQRHAPADKMTFLPRADGHAVALSERAAALTWLVLFSLWE